MKRLFLIISVFIGIQQCRLIVAQKRFKTNKSTAQMDNGIDFDFDAMDEELIASGGDQKIQMTPPSTISIWLRRIGSPLLLKYLALKAFLVHRWHKLVGFTQSMVGRIR